MSRASIPRTALGQLQPPSDADIFRIPVGPGALHVERYGHGGTPVVLLHGFGTSSFLWRHVGPALALARHSAFAIDLFGHGESDRPFDADFSLAAQSEYVERALTALRVARALVVGVDFGAGVALRLAATRRERVARQILVNPVAIDDFPGRDVRTLQRNTARFALRVARGLFGASSLLGPLLEESVAERRHMPPRLVGRYLAPYVGREGVNHLLALTRAMRAEDLAEIELGEVRPSTLVVRGERDRWVDAAAADQLARALPNGRCVSLPGVGRLVPEEVPERLTELILEFSTAQTLP